MKKAPTLRKLPPPLFRTSGGETINAAYITKALDMFQPIFKPESSELLTQDWFLYQDDTQVHTATSIQGV
jgi:hypothetical protein